jgi:amicyanin
MKRMLYVFVGAMLIGLAAVCVANAGEKAMPNEVTVENFSFLPQTLTVPVGTSVTWINRDDVPHTVVSTDKKTFVSPALDTDEKFSYTFTAAGTYDYYCSVHPHMKGKIIVQ